MGSKTVGHNQATTTFTFKWLYFYQIILIPHLPIIAPDSFKKDFKKSACLFLKLIAILKYWNLSNMIEKYCTNLNKYSIIIY